MKKECFVIQPISDKKFTKRFDDTYKPAIEKAGFIAYRVDLDPGTRIPIEEIEAKISSSDICFADISIDNPNVWYELGYAFALNKDVVMVCDESRDVFPFDIRHKSIITYKTDAASDFKKLEDDITTKINAYNKSQQTTRSIGQNPIKETEGFSPYELALLALIIGKQHTDESVVPTDDLYKSMGKIGFNDAAIGIGIRSLVNKNLIATGVGEDYNGFEFSACTITQVGVDFILKNTHLFNLEQSKKEIDEGSFYDLPF